MAEVAERRYHVEPFQCWPKLKELRRSAARDLWNAKKDGKISILGTLLMGSSLVGGLNAATFTHGPNQGRILDDPALAIRCHEAADAHGFGMDTCSYLRIQLGSIFIDMHNVSKFGDRVYPDFALEVSMCPAQAKTVRTIAEHYGIPFFNVEIPLDTGAAGRTFFMSQLAEAIEWMEKVSGQKWNDEKFIDAVYNEWDTRTYFSRICELQKHIPAPVDYRMLITVITIMQAAKACRRETTEALKLFLDEVRWRAENNVAALGVEKARLIHEGMHPHYAYADKPAGFLLRAGAEYGAVILNCTGVGGGYGAWKTDEQGGAWKAPQTLRERGIVLKTREDALHSMAELYMDTYVNPKLFHHFLKPYITQHFIDDWHIDGVIINNDHSCFYGLTPGLQEVKRSLQEKGIPTMVYEAANCDPREFDYPKVMDELNSFMELLGLRKP